MEQEYKRGYRKFSICAGSCAVCATLSFITRDAAWGWIMATVALGYGAENAVQKGIISQVAAHIGRKK